MNTTPITIEHSVVASDRSYEQVIEALEAQLGLREATGGGEGTWP